MDAVKEFFPEFQVEILVKPSEIRFERILREIHEDCP